MLLCRGGRSAGGGQTGGGERHQPGEHHHEQRCEGPDGQPQAEDGGETGRESPWHPLFQREDYMVTVYVSNKIILKKIKELF